MPNREKGHDEVQPPGFLYSIRKVDSPDTPDIGFSAALRPEPAMIMDFEQNMDQSPILSKESMETDDRQWSEPAKHATIVVKTGGNSCTY